MGEYILSVVSAAFCVGLLEELVPNEFGTKVYLRLLTGLCILAVMIAPMGRLLSSVEDLFFEIVELEESGENEYEKILKENLGEAVRSELVVAIKRDLAERFGVKNEGTEVGIQLGGAEGLSVTRLIITLKGGDILKNPYEIEDYFGELLECECRVIAGGWN
jgi:hypothetical protein